MVHGTAPSATAHRAEGAGHTIVLYAMDNPHNPITQLILFICYTQLHSLYYLFVTHNYTTYIIYLLHTVTQLALFICYTPLHKL